MIYSDNIKIPVLCPIFFGVNRESIFYKKRDAYVPKIISDTQVFVWIDNTMLDKTFVLKQRDENGFFVDEVQLIINTIGNYNYISGTITKPNDTRCVQFVLFADDDIIADTMYYEINPYYDKDIKVIEYTHYENDFDFVFYREQTIFNVVGGIAISPIEIDASNSPFLQYLSVGNALLKIGDNDVSSYGATIESIEENVITFSVEYVGNNLHNLYVDGDILQFETQEKQHIQNVYSIALECGFIPSDYETKGQIEDFDGQDLFNKIVDARPQSTEKLTIGDNGGVPNWLAHKINVITMLSSVTIDGEEFVRVKDAQFEKEDDREGMGVWKVEMQSKNEDYIPFKIFDNTFANPFN